MRMASLSMVVYLDAGVYNEHVSLNRNTRTTPGWGRSHRAQLYLHFEMLRLDESLMSVVVVVVWW